MGKKSSDNKSKINRNSLKESSKKSKKSNKKIEKKSKKSEKKREREKIDESNSEEENLEEIVIIGQKHPTPPAGDATRAFYESLLEQRPDSIMAKRYCVEHGCLDNEKAKEFIKFLDSIKKKKIKFLISKFYFFFLIFFLLFKFKFF